MISVDFFRHVLCTDGIGTSGMKYLSNCPEVIDWNLLNGRMAIDDLSGDVETLNASST
jgi:hypothetical protein